MNEIEKPLVSGCRTWLVPAVLIVGITIVVLWEVMANRSRSPFRPFDLTAENFKGFSPSVEGWTFQPVPVSSSPGEPNIIAIRVGRSLASRSPFLVRLAHGYNMCDCMRLKGYKVEMIEERSQTASAFPKASVDKEDSLLRQGYVGHGGQHSALGTRPPAISCQIWRLTSGAGDVSIWVTSMIRAGDFGVLDMDVRSMAFPRIAVPDDPGWVPHGLTLASLKHPIDNFRIFLMAKWNNARCDPATFLRLKTPAWASNEILTLVSNSGVQSVKAEQEGLVIQDLLFCHYLLTSQLQSWSTEKGGR